ncbi:MAG: Gldg family protein [Candidatus Pseudobacter hemicellulosilyticus]|uniref:Gldg family protein n=1 Tax=Candidatus Pseudobacter hemicellulosilyticus TaxID=3121375 RepID=A0AAJ6BHP6_9BACT|nr:MAG: Gldg family protein [Pseudobacter sp.]
MRVLFKIAWAELRTLFYSPIAWVILVVFFIISGVLFVEPLVEHSRIQEISQSNNPNYEGFKDGYSASLFAETFSAILFYLYLFIPLLTMGVFSREINNGSIRLLYSSPVSVRELVFGKYLGLLLFNLVLLSGVAILLITGMLSIREVEYKIYLAAFLGLFLLSATYSAIGLFISCLTGYQLLAGLATMMVFVLLGFIGNFWQGYDFFRDISYFLSLPNRVDRMINGLITSRDLLYYLLIIAMFLSFTLLKLKSTQAYIPRSRLIIRYALIFLLISCLGYFSSRPGYIAYLDVTNNKINTIDSTVQEVFKEFDGSPITVTLYANLFDGRFALAAPKNRNHYVWDFWEKYRRFYPAMKMKYEYYYKIDPYNQYTVASYAGKTIHEIASLTAKTYETDFSLFKKPEQIDSLFDFTHEPALLLMELEYKGKKSVLRTFEVKPHWPPDRVVAGSLRRLVRDSTPALLFTTGHYERSPNKFGEREFGGHTNETFSLQALTNLGVDIDTVSLRHQEVPLSTAALVVADPRSMLDTTEQQKILDFINDGGNALFYGEYGKEAMLNPILDKIGIRLERGTLFDRNGENSYIDFTAATTAAGNKLAREEAIQSYWLGKGKGADAYMTRPVTLKYMERDGFSVKPILVVKGNKDTWIEQGHYVPDSAMASFSAEQGDTRKDEYVLAVQLTRTIKGKEQRIIVAGDADHMSRFRQNGVSVFNACYSWLLYNDYPVYQTVRIPQDIFLSIGRKTGKMLYTLYVYILPALVLTVGMILLIRRNRN